MLAFRLLEARNGRGVWDSPSLVERAHTAKSQIDFLSDRPIQRGTPGEGAAVRQKDNAAEPLKGYGNVHICMV